MMRQVNIPFLKVGRDRFPYRHFRMQLFHGAPGGIADAPAVRFWRDKQEIEITPPTVHSDNDAADRLPDPHDPIGLAAINGLSMVSREMISPSSSKWSSRRPNSSNAP